MYVFLSYLNIYFILQYETNQYQYIYFTAVPEYCYISQLMTGQIDLV